MKYNGNKETAFVLLTVFISWSLFDRIVSRLEVSELEKVMENKDDPNYQKYLEIRKNNLHKMMPIPVCKFDDL